MARDYGKLLCSAWTDPEWKSLSSEAQRLYLLVLSQPDVSYVGTVPYRPRRWATMSKDSSRLKVTRSLTELVSNGYVIVDYDTQELLIRSFIRHDNPLKVPNMARAMVGAYHAILSHHLREVVVGELVRLLNEAPPPGTAGRPKGWDEVILQAHTRGGMLEEIDGTLNARGRANP